ncbi:MAG: dipeptide epimerase [Candidatus Melainabacteria bacterium]|nr:dipeptide epimerase [Candidatus Melainabacteria bacterium]
MKSAANTKSKSISLSFEALDLTLAYPFGISYGTSSTSHNVLVKLEYDGHIGLGEASPASYHSETPATVLAVLGEIGSKQEKILGNDPFAAVEVARQMDLMIAGNYSAKAAIEMAMHDLAGKICGQPTYKMLGLSSHAYPMTDFTIGIDSPEMIERKTKEAVEAGYKMLKVKVGTNYDHQIIKSVRKMAPNLPLRVDANGGWSVKQAIEMSKFLADHGVEFIEQPLPKNALVEDFRLVRQNAAIPIFADESVCRASDVARLAGAVDGVVVKLAKCGGLLEAIRVIATARAHSMKVMFGMMIESSIGVTAAAHLSSLCDHLDLDGALLLRDDPYQGAVYEDGYLRLPEGPGLGVSERK